MLPILDKIVNQTLCLQNYTLSPGHCKGLAKACGLFLKNKVTRVLFNNCGIDGKEFASILEGLSQLSNFRSIIYKKNEFTKHSLAALEPLLQKPNPNSLDELKFVELKISS